MCQFIESICIEDGQIHCLDLHQARVNRTFDHFFDGEAPLDLEEVIQHCPDDGKHKCRVLYGRKTWTVETAQYTAPKIDSLRIIRDNEISYGYKSADRSQLAGLYNQRKQADDILIIKSGRVTDSYFANLAFYDGETWWTPKMPLLKGVKRAYLIKTGEIQERDIHEAEISGFVKVSLINAMLDLNEVSIAVKNIVR